MKEKGEAKMVHLFLAILDNMLVDQNKEMQTIKRQKKLVCHPWELFLHGERA